MVELENKNILILGSQGMAGHVLMRHFKERGFMVRGLSRTFYNPTKDELLFDVSNFEALKVFITEGNYNVVINAVGVLISDSQQDFYRAFELNALLPRLLHDWSKELGFKTVLISTDCVFDGKVGAYSISDIPNASDSYGLSKRLGEISNDERTLTIRTSIIGPELKAGTGLWHWFANQRGTIFGYSGVFWSGVTTLELARYIEFALNKDHAGLVHLTNGKAISKFDLLHVLQNKGVNSGLFIVEKSDPQSNKTLIYSDLGGFVVNDYETMITSQITFSS